MAGEGGPNQIGEAKVVFTADTTGIKQGAKEAEQVVRGTAQSAGASVAQVDKKVGGIRESIRSFHHLLRTLVFPSIVLGEATRIATALNNAYVEGVKLKQVLDEIQLGSTRALGEIASGRGPQGEALEKIKQKASDDIQKLNETLEEEVKRLFTPLGFFEALFNPKKFAAGAQNEERRLRDEASGKTRSITRSLEEAVKRFQDQQDKIRQTELLTKILASLENSAKQQREYADRMLGQVPVAVEQLGDILTIRGESMRR